ncbi:GerW family sporulation protein [Bacillus inaquosorum]|uniref:GerW family sporulation protein n=1 Tax=Bacillus inaquosorum TaxID=483913 RepID=UPI002280D12F|nr:GerW family sporulation protein [Bacillus inaquosorum]MCY9064181.1 GerW family sporulation protein [Bacillus inaquosorum]MCY9076502.1 GerW family sporulation protein [Bacillus inaquosorum]
MADHPIQGLMKTAMENLKEMIDVNTIIGDPVETPDGSVILTVSKVGFGFAAGGSEFGQKLAEKKSEDDETREQKLPFGGGSGGGVSITPIAFLIVGSTGIRMLHLDENTHLIEKILDAAPQTLERIQQMFKKNNKNQGQGQNQNQMNNMNY